MKSSVKSYLKWIIDDQFVWLSVYQLFIHSHSSAAITKFYLTTRGTSSSTFITDPNSMSITDSLLRLNCYSIAASSSATLETSSRTRSIFVSNSAFCSSAFRSRPCSTTLIRYYASVYAASSLAARSVSAAVMIFCASLSASKDSSHFRPYSLFLYRK